MIIEWLGATTYVGYVCRKIKVIMSLDISGGANIISYHKQGTVVTSTLSVRVLILLTNIDFPVALFGHVVVAHTQNEPPILDYPDNSIGGVCIW